MAIIKATRAKEMYSFFQVLMANEKQIVSFVTVTPSEEYSEMYIREDFSNIIAQSAICLSTGQDETVILDREMFNRVHASVKQMSNFDPELNKLLTIEGKHSALEGCHLIHLEASGVNGF